MSISISQSHQHICFVCVSVCVSIKNLISRIEFKSNVFLLRFCVDDDGGEEIEMHKMKKKIIIENIEDVQLYEHFKMQ